MNHLQFLQAYLPRRSDLGSLHPDVNTLRGSWAFRRVTKQQSARPTGTPLVIEPLDVPAPSERVVPEGIQPIQCGITPKRVALPHPGFEILSGCDEDVSPCEMVCCLADIRSIFSLERPFVSKGSAQSFAMAMTEGTFRPSRQTVFSSRHVSAPSRSTSNLPITLDVLSCSTRILFTRTSRSLPLTSTTLDLGKSTS